MEAARQVGGVSAVAAAAYRSGEMLRDERLDQTYDYRLKDRIVHTEIILPEGAMPEWASHRMQLWNEVERAEKRKDATVAREVEIMLPRELSLAENVALVRAFMLEQFVSKGLVADFAIHEPQASDGGAHVHAHCMITPRALTETGFAAKKDQTFWFVNKGDKSKEELHKLRAAWADRQNEALERKGAAMRVDHRSLAAQRAEALDHADQARERGDLKAAFAAEQRAAQLNRTPQPSLGLAGKVRHLSGFAEARYERWQTWRDEARLRAHVAMSAAAKHGRALEQRIGAALARTVGRLTPEPPPQAVHQRMIPRDAGYER